MLIALPVMHTPDIFQSLKEKKKGTLICHSGKKGQISSFFLKKRDWSAQTANSSSDGQTSNVTVIGDVCTRALLQRPCFWVGKTTDNNLTVPEVMIQCLHLTKILRSDNIWQTGARIPPHYSSLEEKNTPLPLLVLKLRRSGHFVLQNPRTPFNWQHAWGQMHGVTWAKTKTMGSFPQDQS